jgi:metallo-beta-lactamase family protein
VVLTHAHVDHAGFVPRLVAEGFRGPVFATRGTEALCGVVLPDSGRLHEEDASLANAEGWSKHAPALPLYTEEDALRSLQQFRSVETGAWFEVAPGVRGRFSRAGHILGAASLVLEDAESGKRAGFSGDLGRPVHPLLGPPESIARVDALVCESTYGDRRHPPSAQVVAALGAASARTAERGGTTVIPAFAVDRTEVMLLHLRELMQSGAAPRLPVYVDSPMALAALAIYQRAIAERWPEIQPALRGDGALFDPGDLREVRTLAQSRELQAGGAGPCIVVSASGRWAGGCCGTSPPSDALERRAWSVIGAGHARHRLLRERDRCSAATFVAEIVTRRSRPPTRMRCSRGSAALRPRPPFATWCTASRSPRMPAARTA